MMNAVPAVAGTALIAAATTLPAICPFRVWSGQACPLCGMTRAVRSLVTGDMATAWRYHPLVVLVVAQAAVFGLVWLATRSRPRIPMMPAVAAVNAAAFFVVWLVRWRLDLLSFVVT